MLCRVNMTAGVTMRVPEAYEPKLASKSHWDIRKLGGETPLHIQRSSNKSSHREDDFQN